MGQKKTIGIDPDLPDKKQVAKEEKRQRLAAALRDNLQKRKQQARSRTTSTLAEPTPRDSSDSEK